MDQQREDLPIRQEKISWILDRKGYDVWSLPPEATVYEALTLMAEKGVGAIMVVSEGKFEGVISERDYARKVILKDRSSRETKIRDIMATPAVTTTPEQTVNDCMNAMTQHRVRHLPVMKGDQLVGVVSIGDLVNSLLTTHVEAIGQLNNYIKGRS